jgi:hypothetical protein
LTRLSAEFARNHTAVAKIFISQDKMKFIQLLSHNGQLTALDDRGQVYVRSGDRWLPDVGKVEDRQLAATSSFIPSDSPHYKDGDGDRWTRGQIPGAVMCYAFGNSQFRLHEGEVQQTLTDNQIWEPCASWHQCILPAIAALWRPT